MSQMMEVSKAVVPLLKMIEDASQARRPVKLLIEINAAEIKISSVGERGRHAFTSLLDKTSVPVDRRRQARNNE